MEQIIAQMLPGLLSSLVTACAGALAGYLAGRRKEAKAEDKNVKIAVKALLRGQVMDLGLHYISKATSRLTGWNPCAIIMTPMLLWEMATRPSSTLSKRAKVSPYIAEKWK